MRVATSIILAASTLIAISTSMSLPEKNHYHHSKRLTGGTTIDDGDEVDPTQVKAVDSCATSCDNLSSGLSTCVLNAHVDLMDSSWPPKSINFANLVNCSCADSGPVKQFSLKCIECNSSQAALQSGTSYAAQKAADAHTQALVWGSVCEIYTDQGIDSAANCATMGSGNGCVTNTTWYKEYNEIATSNASNSTSLSTKFKMGAASSNYVISTITFVGVAFFATIAII